MSKIFFWLGIFLAIYFALKMVGVMQRKKAVNAMKERSSKHLPALLACARCGVHFPSADAVEKEGRFFCSADHAR
jgi:formylmethanofuran dehydrogenase subunit E